MQGDNIREGGPKQDAHIVHLCTHEEGRGGRKGGWLVGCCHYVPALGQAPKAAGHGRQGLRDTLYVACTTRFGGSHVLHWRAPASPPPPVSGMSRSTALCAVLCPPVPLPCVFALASCHAPPSLPGVCSWCAP